MKSVLVHTDGACSGNPGPGGYAAVVDYDGCCHEVVGGFRLTTNNRMELFAALAALRLLKEPCRVTIVTDSQYLHKGFTLGWVLDWQRKGWKRGGKKIPNRDLWEELISLAAPHHISWQWVRGHSEDAGNERCDCLAREAIRKNPVAIDGDYERSRGENGYTTTVEKY